MACCMLGVMFIWQMIEAWRRVKAFLGLPVKAVTRAGVAAGNLRLRITTLLHKPWARVMAILLLSTELAIGGDLAYRHRDHIQEELASAAVFVGLSTFDPRDVYICRVTPKRASLAANP